MTEEPIPQIFLSHSHEDAGLVQQVKQALEQAGACRVYLAADHPQPGDSLPGKLVDAIKASQGFVVLLTQAGTASKLVNQEIGAARAERKTIVALAEGKIADSGAALGMCPDPVM